MEIRPALESDQAAIVNLVRQSRINRRDIHWQRFLVAAEDDAIIGIGQVKIHADGARELASIAVAPTHQHRGIASQIVRALIERETQQGHRALYLFCESKLQPFYERFGFELIERADTPHSLAREVRFIRPIARVASFILRRTIRVAVMRRVAS